LKKDNIQPIFIKIQRVILAYKKLSPRAYQILSILIHHDIKGDGYVYPSGTRLAKMVGIREQNISRYVQELIKYGFIKKSSKIGRTYEIELTVPEYTYVHSFTKDINYLFFDLDYSIHSAP